MYRCCLGVRPSATFVLTIQKRRVMSALSTITLTGSIDDATLAASIAI